MTLQWIGALLVVVGCGGMGYYMARAYAKEINTLMQLSRVLDEMEWELEYRLTPLPELCSISAANTSGILQKVFSSLSELLIRKEYPDVKNAMDYVLSKENLSPKLSRHLKRLGASLGRYDMHGQVLGLRSIKTACRKDLDILENGKQERIRGYQTLALCTGAAIAIILI